MARYMKENRMESKLRLKGYIMCCWKVNMTRKVRNQFVNNSCSLPI